METKPITLILYFVGFCALGVALVFGHRRLTRPTYYPPPKDGVGRSQQIESTDGTGWYLIDETWNTSTGEYDRKTSFVLRDEELRPLTPPKRKLSVVNDK